MSPLRQYWEKTSGALALFGCVDAQVLISQVSEFDDIMENSGGLEPD